MPDVYIANQITEEGLDELQRLLLAYQLRLHVAIDGPPGVGKTHSILELSKILGLHLYTKTCSSRTTESHIISFPVLSSDNGTSVTRYVNGPLCRAMADPGIFYGDEFNLLKEDVQKRMNSAFDERRYIDRIDGKQLNAKPGFWAVISYNPSENLVSRDLEDSVADRFIHFHYKRWQPDFKALVSSTKAEGITKTALQENNPFGIQLSWRGFGKNMEFLVGRFIEAKLKWFYFFTGKPAKVPPLYKYLVYDTVSMFSVNKKKKTIDLDTLASQVYSKIELARMISRFTDVLSSISRTGESPFLRKIGLGELKEKEDLELMSIHESSARIEMAAMKHYSLFLEREWNKYLAQAYSVRLVLDQVCYGQYRDRKLRESTVYEIAQMIAKNMRLLLDNTQYNTKLITDKLLKNWACIKAR